jgi:hypothetical protein
MSANPRLYGLSVNGIFINKSNVFHKKAAFIKSNKRIDRNNKYVPRVCHAS